MTGKERKEEGRERRRRQKWALVPAWDRSGRGAGGAGLDLGRAGSLGSTRRRVVTPPALGETTQLPGPGSLPGVVCNCGSGPGQVQARPLVGGQGRCEAGASGANLDRRFIFQVAVPSLGLGVPCSPLPGARCTPPPPLKTLGSVSVLHPERWSPRPLRVLAVQEGPPQGKSPLIGACRWTLRSLGRGALQCLVSRPCPGGRCLGLSHELTRGSLSWA